MLLPMKQTHVSVSLLSFTLIHFKSCCVSSLPLWCCNICIDTQNVLQKSIAVAGRYTWKWQNCALSQYQKLGTLLTAPKQQREKEKRVLFWFGRVLWFCLVDGKLLLWKADFQPSSVRVQRSANARVIWECCFVPSTCELRWQKSGELCVLGKMFLGVK